MRTKSGFCFSFVILLFIQVSCSSHDEDKSYHKETSQDQLVEEEQFDTIRPDNITFPPFEDTVIVQILEGLKMCSTDSSKHDELAPCNHNWFRVFKYMPEKPWEAGFLVEAKAGIYTPTRMVVCIYHQKNKYRIVNQYLGVVLEIIPKSDGKSDLIMGYEDPEVGTVAILHKWEGEHYEPKVVLEINNRFVKEQFKDSLNQRFVKNFYWGE